MKLLRRGHLLLWPRRARPLHYLDYFHGELSVSPAENWIADNGWVWHPSGIVTSWSLQAWFNGNSGSRKMVRREERYAHAPTFGTARFTGSMNVAWPFGDMGMTMMADPGCVHL